MIQLFSSWHFFFDFATSLFDKYLLNSLKLINILIYANPASHKYNISLCPIESKKDILYYKWNANK